MNTHVKYVHEGTKLSKCDMKTHIALVHEAKKAVKM